MYGALKSWKIVLVLLVSISAVTAVLQQVELSESQPRLQSTTLPPTEIVGLWPLPNIELKSTARLGAEFVLFDEIDLFHRSNFLFDFHADTNPERVRRNNSEYFFRSDRNGAGHGQWYGELRLKSDATNGGLLYLPHDTDFTNKDSVSFLVKKSNPQSKIWFRLYRNAETFAELVEGDELFPKTIEGEWHRVEFPIDQLRFSKREAVKPKLPDRASRGKNVYHFLGAIPSRDGQVFAIEFGLRSAEPVAGGTLKIDRISLIRHTLPERMVRGRVEPPAPGVEIHVRSPSDKWIVETDEEGRFELALPADVDRIEALLRHNNVWHLPRIGRYIEIGSFIPELTFDLGAARGVKYPARKGQVYKHTREHGEVYEPGSFVIMGGKPDNSYGLVEAQSNRFGYRDQDHDVANLDNQFRIGLFGACHIDGRQVTSQEHVCTQLEAIFNFEGEAVECFNLGQGHQTLTGHYSAVKNLLPKVEMDLALINTVGPAQFALMNPERHGNNKGFDPAHPNADYFVWDAEAGKTRHIPFDPDYLKFRSGRPTWEKDKISAYDRRFSFEMCALSPDQRSDDVEDAITAFGDGLSAMKRAVGDDTDLGLMMPITFADAARETDGVTHNLALFPSLMSDIASDAGFQFIDISKSINEKIIRADGTRAYGWPGSGHMSAATHRFMAEALAEYMRTDHEGFARWHAGRASSDHKHGQRLRILNSTRQGVFVSSHLNPVFHWNLVHDADRFEVKVTSDRFGHMVARGVVKDTRWQVPVSQALSPGQSYTFSVRGVDKDGKKGPRAEVAVTIRGTDLYANFEPGGLLRSRQLKHFRKLSPAMNKYPSRHRMTSIAAGVDDPMLIRRAAREAASGWLPEYEQLLELIRSNEYEFKSFSEYTPEDIGKKLVFLRFDVHINDIGDTYAFIDANLRHAVPANYELTWELGPLQFDSSQDFVNLRRFSDESGLVRFGLHLNPIRTWLGVEHFDHNHMALLSFTNSDEGHAEALALANTGTWKFGTETNFFEKIDQYTGLLFHRFRQWFPNSATISSHGQTAIWRPTEEDRENGSARKLNQYSVLSVLANYDMLRKHGIRYNHTVEARRPGTAFIIDPLRKNTLRDTTLERLNKALADGKTVFMYIHPSAAYR